MIMLCFFFVLLQTSPLRSDALTSNPKKPLFNPKPIGPIHTLILTRHGDSLWNGKYPGCRETFTGWTDVDLSPIGEQEAIRTAKILSQTTRGVNIDALFTSTLTRAKMTAHYCWWAYYDRSNEPYQQRKDNEGDNTPGQFVMDYRLNERHYGSLQGLVKADAEAGDHGHSPEDVYKWRRSWHAIPPPMEDNDPRRIEEFRKYGSYCDVPRSESLSMVAENRIRPFLSERLTPILDDADNSNSSASSEDISQNDSKIESGGTALIVAHANSIRALIGVICNVEQDPHGLALGKLESMKIPTASPLVIKYRKTTEEGRYFAVGSAGKNDSKNELPVYLLSSLQLMRKAASE